MTAHEETEPVSPHRDIATRLLDGRSTAGSPALSPDGERVAFVVATIDLERNETTMRIWLQTGDRDATPITAGPRDRDPQWSPDGRWLAFASSRGEEEQETTVHVLPVDGPGEVRTVATMADGAGDLRWSPDGRWLAFTSRDRDPRYDAKDERWQSPRKIERFFSRLDNEGWVFDRPRHVYVVAADGTGKPRDLTPGPFQHGGIAWLNDSSGVVTTAARHDTWDRDFCEDLYVVPLDGEPRALTKQTGLYQLPSVSPDGSRVAFLGIDDATTYPQNVRVVVTTIDGGQHRWVSTGRSA